MKHLFYFLITLNGCTVESNEVFYIAPGPTTGNTTVAYPNEPSANSGCYPGTHCAAPSLKQRAIICFPDEDRGINNIPKEQLPVYNPTEPPWGPESLFCSNNVSCTTLK